MISDPRFDELIGGIIHETMDEASILADVHKGRVIESPSTIRFCHLLIEEIPTAHAELLSRFPDAQMEETVLGIVQMAWDYGFRAGRMFQARGYEVPGEDNDDE